MFITDVYSYMSQYQIKGHLFIKDTACCPNYIELCTKLPLK